MTPETILNAVLTRYNIQREVFFLPARWNGGFQNVVKLKYPSGKFIDSPIGKTPKLTDARAIFVNMMYRQGYQTKDIYSFFSDNGLKRDYSTIRHLRDLTDEKRKRDGEFADMFNDVLNDLK